MSKNMNEIKNEILLELNAVLSADYGVSKNEILDIEPINNGEGSRLVMTDGHTFDVNAEMESINPDFVGQLIYDSNRYDVSKSSTVFINKVNELLKEANHNVFVDAIIDYSEQNNDDLYKIYMDNGDEVMFVWNPWNHNGCQKEPNEHVFMGIVKNQTTN